MNFKGGKHWVDVWPKFAITRNRPHDPPLGPGTTGNATDWNGSYVTK